jgi:hypothetical protein
MPKLHCGLSKRLKAMAPLRKSAMARFTVTVTRLTRSMMPTVEAKAAQERDVTDCLRKLYTTKLVDNSKRQMKQMGYEIAESSDNDLLNKIKAKEKMAKDPELAEMTKREQACFGALEDALRARSSAIPLACTSLK